jgi:hypothetical protein
LLNDLHCTDKSDSLPRNGLDQSLLRTTVANRPPRRVYAAVERCLGNDSSFPNGSEQVVFADHSLAVADQMGKKVEYLRLNSCQSPVATKFATISVERKAFKNIEQFVIPRRSIGIVTPAEMPEKSRVRQGKLPRIAKRIRSPSRILELFRDAGRGMFYPEGARGLAFKRLKKNYKFCGRVIGARTVCSSGTGVVANGSSAKRNAK